MAYGEATIVMKSREMTRSLRKEGILTPSPRNPIRQDNIRRKR
jgi:hypothetical protein